jgi:hypothetical protein
MAVFSIIPLAKCQPLTANWDMYDPTYMKTHKCINDLIALPVAAALSAATDLAAVIIPLVILSGLREPLKQKLGLYSVFAVGFMYVLPFSGTFEATANVILQRRWSRNSTHSSHCPIGQRKSRLHLYVSSLLSTLCDNSLFFTYP